MSLDLKHIGMYLKVGKTLIIGEIASLLILIIFSICFLPNIAFILITGISAVYLSARIFYTFTRNANKLGFWILLIVTLIMSAGIISNIWGYTSGSGATIDSPALIYDSNQLYNCAKDIYNNGYNNITPKVYTGYPILISSIWSITGINIVVPLLINLLFILFSIIIGGMIANRLIEYKNNACDSARITSIAMLCIAMPPFFLSQGMMVMKEPSIYLGIAMAGYTISPFYTDNSSKAISLKDTIIFIIACFLITSTRLTYIYLLIIGLIIPLILAYKSPKTLSYISLLIAISVAFIFIGKIFSPYNISEHSDFISGENGIGQSYTLTNGDFYHALIGDYMSKSIWFKILLLPISLALQYIIPFPWGFTRDISFGYSQIYPHFSVLWYIVGGLICYYYIFISWRKEYRYMLAWGIWVLICYITPAFLFGGTVPRYALPFITIMAPLAVTVIFSLKDKQHLPLFKKWAFIYVSLLSGVLMLCYFLK